MLKRIRVVLVNTSHPGNIGSAARAMKTMGLSRLYLVNPISFPDPKASELAAGAEDVLDQAIVVSSLDQAIADCGLVIGTSARMRKIPWPLVSPREMAEQIKKESDETEIALIFGRENSGLSNEELHRCQLHVHIPANPVYSSLNLASAVQILSYELYQASFESQASVITSDYPLATSEELEKLFEHLQQVLVEIEFLNPKAPRQLMTRLRRFFFRARPDVMEMNILRGMLSAMQAGNKFN